MTVYANGLEVACKAQSNKVIAAFPDVCFTPPENPATPPGVPVPYPSFGLDSDTDNGTGTVKIGGENITQKNKSYYTKTSGTEAGCAAKKGVVTSVNTGKEYADAWSGDVKAESMPISRFSDISTNNHASPTGNAPPWPKIGKINKGTVDCDKLLAKYELSIHKHSEKDCPEETMESEHFVENQFFQEERGGVENTFDEFKNYDVDSAPCICMQASKKKKGVPKENWPKRGTDHHAKSGQVRDFIKDCTSTPSVEKTTQACCKAVVDNHSKTEHLSQGTKKEREEAENIAKCLEKVFIKHLTDKINEKRTADGKKKATEQEVRDTSIGWEVNPAKGRMWVY